MQGGNLSLSFHYLLHNDLLPQKKATPSPSDLLWRNCFTDPSLWQHIRITKIDSTPQDFEHKTTKDPLWIYGSYNPYRFQEELRRRQVHSTERQGSGKLCIEMKTGKATGAHYEEEEDENELYNQQTSRDDPREAVALVALIKACAKQKDLHRAGKIHADAAKSGLTRNNVFVGSALVNMYAKCGALKKAQDVFDKLQVRNIVSWNALIAGYVHSGQGEEALMCYEQMQLEKFTPNAITFVCILKACGSLRALEKGQDIHAQIVRDHYMEITIEVANAVVDMYAKCGALKKAQEVFDELRVRDVVSWTTLITGYAQNGCAKEALNHYERMQFEGYLPNAFTFVCILKVCGNIGALDKGREVHAQAEKGHYLEKNSLVANAVVDMYAKCGAVEKAQEVFDNLDVCDVGAWTALIVGYAQHGYGEQALTCFERMQLEGIAPNTMTFACLLKVCGSIGAADKGQYFHAQILRIGLLEKDIVIANALVDMYAKCGALAKAQEVFDELRDRDVVSWTALIVGYVLHEHGQEALNCFEKMQRQGFLPDAITYACILKACGSIGAVDKGKDIHAQIDSENLLEKSVMVANSLVDMYAKCGALAIAHEVFHGLRVRDIVSWNALIAGYVQHKHYVESMSCFMQMQYEGFFPDEFTFACILKACGSIGALLVGQKIHAEIVRYGMLEKDMVIGTGLVDMYANCGMLTEAQKVFDKLPVRNVVSWSALLEGYAQLGKDELVFSTFNKMLGEGRVPDPITFTIVLNTCSHGGFLEKGQMCFEIISKDHAIIPTLENYACMLDLFCRAGNFDKAVAVLEEMPLSATLTMLHTLLGACRKWGNMKLARWAFEYAVQLDDKDDASYICMSSIYITAGRQEDAEKIEALKVKKQASKKRVLSWWNDEHGVVHSFSMGYNEHPQMKDIHLKLDHMAYESSQGGYPWVPLGISEDEKRDVLCGHTEKYAIACALINAPQGTHIYIVKNLRVCHSCHVTISLISKQEKRKIFVRDTSCLHTFEEGKCFCGEDWQLKQNLLSS